MCVSRCVCLCVCKCMCPLLYMSACLCTCVCERECIGFMQAFVCIYVLFTCNLTQLLCLSCLFRIMEKSSIFTIFVEREKSKDGSGVFNEYFCSISLILRIENLQLSYVYLLHFLVKREIIYLLNL